MQRWSYLFVVALFAAACPPLSELKCDASNPCPAGASCNADGYCVEQGTGGGSGGGGGGAGGGMGTCAPCGDGGNEFQVCVGGACVAKYQKLEWEAPVEGSFTADASVALRAKLTVGAPSVAPWPSVSVKFEKGGAAGPVATLTYANGFYEGAQVLADGVWKATVSSVGDAGLSAVVNFTVDTVAPVLTMRVPPVPYGNDGGPVNHLDTNFPNAWKRDDKVVVQVTANEPVRFFSVMVNGIPGAGVVPIISAALPAECPAEFSDCDASNCGCFEANLWVPSMEAFSGEFTVTAGATDLAGNRGEHDAGTLRVTRLRWTRPMGKAMKATPAIGSDGVVYAAGTDGIAGYVWAVDENGDLKWQSADLGEIEASPSVAKVPDGGPEIVFYASKSGSNAWLGALRTDNGTNYDPNLIRCAIGGASEAPPSPTVMASGLSVGAVTVLGNSVCAYIANATSMTRAVSQIATASVATSANLTNVVALGDRVAFADVSGNVVAYSIGSLGNWSSTPIWSATLGGGGVIRGLAVHGPLTGRKIVGGGGPGVGQLFQLNDAMNGTIDWKYPAGGATSTWGPSVLDQSNIFYGIDTPVKEIQRRGQSDAGFLQKTLVSATNATPLIGSDGSLYVTTVAGEVIALEIDRLRILWNSGPILTDVRASPTLDCNRRYPTRSGLLYLASTNGNLASVFVDDRKLGTAAWPKYQHDSANSGNPDWPLNPGCP